MYVIGDIVANRNRSVVDRSFPPDVTLLAVTVGMLWSDQTTARNLQLAAWPDLLLGVVL